MSLQIWSTTPFDTSSAVGLIDTFTTDGVTATYSVVNKTIAQVGARLQYSNILKNRFDGGFTLNDTSITLDNTPVAGLKGVIPALNAVICAAYDNTNLVANGNVEEVSFFVGTTQPNNYYYLAPQASAGIGIFPYNNIPNTGPDLSWVQLACADASGNALSFQATGTTLYTDNMASFSTVSSSAIAGTNTIIVNNPSAGFYFINGDYLIFNIGNVTQEIVRLTSQSKGVSTTTLTMAASFNSPHYVGETVYFYAREFWLKETVPIGYTNNTAANYYNISINVEASENART